MDSIVRLVGEGYSRPQGDSQVPIDVKYDKLSEFLVDRKQVPTDWNRRLQAVQAQAAAAAQELPPALLAQLAGGEDVPVDYPVARAIRDKLAETAETGLLGGYKGSAGVWDKIVRAYESGMLHVAEAAQTLARNADYEIPFFKKGVARAQQTLADLERRKAEAQKGAVAAAADFKAECADLGVDPGALRPSLLALAAELPSLLGGAVERLRSEQLGETVLYYQAFVEAAASGEGTEAGAAGAEDLLPTLAEVRAGRTAPPSATQLAAAASSAAEAEEPAGDAGAGGGIDWGNVGGDSGAVASAPAAAGGISWDLEPADLVPGGDEGPAGISWDVQAEQPGSGGNAVTLDINWDIDLSGTGEEAGGAGDALPAGSTGATGSAAAGPAAAADAAIAAAPAEVQRLIADHEYRTRLLDDLHELLAFLTQRCSELSGSKGVELLGARAPEAVQRVSADIATGMKAGVASALAAFDDEKAKRLLAIRTSARYVDRLATALAKKGGQEAKLLRAAQEAESKRTEMQRQLMADTAKLAVLTQQTRRAKETAETALGAKLGRRINVQGDLP